MKLFWFVHSCVQTLVFYFWLIETIWFVHNFHIWLLISQMWSMLIVTFVHIHRQSLLFNYLLIVTLWFLQSHIVAHKPVLCYILNFLLVHMKASFEFMANPNFMIYAHFHTNFPLWIVHHQMMLIYAHYSTNYTVHFSFEAFGTK